MTTKERLREVSEGIDAVNDGLLSFKYMMKFFAGRPKALDAEMAGQMEDELTHLLLLTFNIMEQLRKFAEEADEGARDMGGEE